MADGHPLPGPRGLRAQRTAATTVLIDPFLTGNPKAAASADEVEADAILLTHGHGDHLGDTVDIAKRTGATVRGDRRARRPRSAGTASRTSSTRTSAAPCSSTGAGSSSSPPGTRPSRRAARAHMPAGLLIHIGDRLIYHLGDTCLFSDMQLIARRGDKVDLALVPIGGHYTMDRFDAVTAVRVHRRRSRSSPATTTRSRRSRPTRRRSSPTSRTPASREVVVLEPGETHTLK